MPNVLPTQKTEWGFWGTSNRNGYNTQLTWEAAADILTTAFDLQPSDVRDLLDAKFGRHLADDLSFIKDGPTSYEKVEQHMMQRLSVASWRKWFEDAIRDLRIGDVNN